MAAANAKAAVAASEAKCKSAAMMAAAGREIAEIRQQLAQSEAVSQSVNTQASDPRSVQKLHNAVRHE